MKNIITRFLLLCIAALLFVNIPATNNGKIALKSEISTMELSEDVPPGDRGTEK